MTNEERLRLFVAADVPDRHLSRIAELTEELRDLWPSARWTAAENQHVTLKFLGPTTVGGLGEVRRVSTHVAEQNPRSKIWLSQFGAFPNQRRARVLWIGIADPYGSLRRAASDLDLEFESLGYRAEERAFTPHLTLARFKVPTRIDALPTLAVDELPAVPFEHLSLYRSRLSPRGAVYELLDNFALA
jgi:RNA 2',3'-cyclic 3'-phosphodiesterase